MTVGGRTSCALWSRKSGATKTESRNGSRMPPSLQALKSSTSCRTFNAFHELKMGVGLLFSSSIYQRACCHLVGSFSNQNAFPSTDFFSPIDGDLAAFLPTPFLHPFVLSSLHGGSRARFFPKAVSWGTLKCHRDKSYLLKLPSTNRP